MYVRSFVVSITSMSLTLFWLASKQINIPENFQVWSLFLSLASFLIFIILLTFFYMAPYVILAFKTHRV